MENETPTLISAKDCNTMQNYGRVSYLLHALIEGSITKEHAARRLAEIEAEEKAHYEKAMAS